MAGFKPQEHMTKLQGKDYLEVKWRLVWFREQHPTGAITTELIATDPSVIVRASVHAGDGVILATGYGTAPAAGKGTWTGRSVEKSETAAIGRALAHAGYGTQFDADDDTDNLADSPVEASRKPAPEPAPAANGWTQAQAASLVTEANALHVATDQLLALLDVERISQYGPGFSEARAALKRYVEARPADGAPLPDDLFGGNSTPTATNERKIR